MPSIQFLMFKVIHDYKQEQDTMSICERLIVLKLHKVSILIHISLIVSFSFLGQYEKVNFFL